MKIIVIYFFAQLLLHQTVLGSQLKNKDNAESRIVDGSPVIEKENPWYAAIAIQKEKTLVLCGGSLISNQWILTSAQCIDGAEIFSVGLGKPNLDDYETNKLLVSTDGIKHEEYDKNTLNNDIGLIKLPKPVMFSDRINATRLPSRNLSWQSLDDEHVYISGHGRDANDSITNNLTSLQVNTVSLTRCKDYYGIRIHLRLLCATATDGTGPCYNDTGNPLILYEADGYATQIGIFSYFHDEGCDYGYPSVYTRVGKYVDWIYNKTGVKIKEDDDGGANFIQVSNFAIGLTLFIWIANVF